MAANKRWRVNYSWLHACFRFSLLIQASVSNMIIRRRKCAYPLLQSLKCLYWQAGVVVFETATQCAVMPRSWAESMNPISRRIIALFSPRWQPMRSWFCWVIVSLVVSHQLVSQFCPCQALSAHHVWSFPRSCTHEVHIICAVKCSCKKQKRKVIISWGRVCVCVCFIRGKLKIIGMPVEVIRKWRELIFHSST